MLIYFLLFALQDTLVPSLAWPYYISQSAQVEGYKAVKFSPTAPCSINQFLCGVGSPVSNVSKECSLMVWCDAGDYPGPRLFSEVISISVIDSAKIYWHSYDLVPPLHMVGPFWAGLWESSSFPTTVFDGGSSSRSSYAQDGMNWDSVGGDYFYGVVIRHIQPQLHVDPESLVLHISADSNQSDTGVLTIMNGSALCNLSVDSIIWSEPWVVSAIPNSFGLLPMGSKDVRVVCGNVFSDGVYYDTLYIFSNDFNNNPYPIPLVLIVTDYGVAQGEEFGVARLVSLSVLPNPFIGSSVVRIWGFGISEDRVTADFCLRIYDITGRMVCALPILGPQFQIPIGQELAPGIYFVRVKGSNSTKVIKLR